MSDKPRNPSEPKPGAGRKPYSKPKVQTYGGIRVITEDIGSMGNTDSGSAPKTKSM